MKFYLQNFRDFNLLKSNSQNKAYRPVMDAVFIVLVLGLTVLAFIVFVCQLVLCVGRVLNNF